ncbi:MAG: hypothetical protein IJW03_05620 [Clostridia bacterium]|nr:hypothetical protein [Clostridia bacterium]
MAIVKALLIALSLGTLCAGVLLFLSTHKLISLAPYVSFIIGGGVLFASGAVAYILLRQNDGAIARALDEQYSLDERVRTMLEYKDQNGAIYELQRDDTDKALEGVKRSSFGTKHLWIYITAAALSTAVFVTSVLFIPQAEPPKPAPDSPFSITKLQVIAMEELIAYVEGSDMESPYRESVALSLTNLLADLKLASTVSERDSALKISVDEIYKQTDASSSAVEIIDALARNDSGTVRGLAYAINHYSWSRGGEWDSFTERMTAVRDDFIHADSASETPDEQKMANDTRALLSAAGDSIVSALARSQIEADDILYAALLNFAQRSADDGGAYGLGALAESGSDLSYAELQHRLDLTFTGYNIEIFRALEVLSENTGVGEYAMTRLSDLFGYKLPALDRPENHSSGEGGEGGDSTGEGGGNGAIGEGTVFGSDELVLDPFTGKYVEYGEIFNKYYTIMFTRLQGDSYTDEEKAAMEKYFDILYGGFHE